MKRLFKNHPKSRVVTLLTTAIASTLIPMAIPALTLNLPAADYAVVGDNRTIIARAGDTLASLALSEGVGFDALVAANPQLNPWFPGEGASVTLPTRYVLPNTPREGIVVNLPELRLYYYVPDSDTVMVYPIGIGRTGRETPVMTSRISSVTENPTWTPPQSIRKHYAEQGVTLPSKVPPGEDNPLGKHALRLGNTEYLIHGTNNPAGVGMRVSSGCIRLYPEHIRELAELVSVGTTVTIVNQPVKWGLSNLSENKPDTSDDTNEAELVQAYRPLKGAGYDNRAAIARVLQVARQARGLAAEKRIRGFLRAKFDSNQLFSGLPQRVQTNGSDPDNPKN